ncbi:MAG: hypothetical protein COT43_06220 [Candidatus Marinimicrobia bacterium CG08_land_8_20_14_0_20_45_22]|nr:MAG: hypothetical protein COT43_06220 [Candidatus Marinimicrobia bacterium CG08_land_8_20_14_0_20_45_22]
MRTKIRISALLLLAFMTELSSQTVIPSWFKELPDAPAGVMYAVGYCGKYQNMNSAKRKAIDVALNTLAKQKSIHLKFYIEEINDGRMSLINPIFQLIYEEDILKEIRNDYSIVDSSITTDGYFVLIASPKTKKNVTSDDVNWGPPPDWIQNTPESKKWRYGVGIAARYSNWTKAWRDTDEYARFDVGKNTSINTESITVIRRTDRTASDSKIMRQYYDMYFKDSIIVERYYNAQTNSYYSLCRVPK